MNQRKCFTTRAVSGPAYQRPRAHLWSARHRWRVQVAASLCVLPIACTNLANLLMSRALARRNEFAVRVAVGASTDRLVRQMLPDSLLLAGAGGVLGVLLAIHSAPLVVRLVPSSLPIAEVPAIDLRMLFGAAAITVLTGVAFDLVVGSTVPSATLIPAVRSIRGPGSGIRDPGILTG